MGAEGHPGKRLTRCPLPGTGLASTGRADGWASLQVPMGGRGPKGLGKRLPHKEEGAKQDELD